MSLPRPGAIGSWLLVDCSLVLEARTIDGIWVGFQNLCNKSRVKKSSIGVLQPLEHVQSSRAVSRLPLRLLRVLHCRVFSTLCLALPNEFFMVARFTGFAQKLVFKMFEASWLR